MQKVKSEEGEGRGGPLYNRKAVSLPSPLTPPTSLPHPHGARRNSHVCRENTELFTRRREILQNVLGVSLRFQGQGGAHGSPTANKNTPPYFQPFLIRPI